VDVVTRSLVADAGSAFKSLLLGGTIGMVAALLVAGESSLGPIAAGALVGGGLAMGRCLRISLRLDEEGVTVANYLRTWQLAWADIAAIGWDRFEGTHAGLPSVAFRLVDGETIVAQAAWGLGRRRRERLIEAMQELGRTREIGCYLSADDLKATTRHHSSKPLSEHPALPKVDRRITLVRHHPWLGWLFFVVTLGAFALLPFMVRELIRS
jgi:Bacterial PH domain